MRGVQDMSFSHGVGKVVFLATLAGERGGERGHSLTKLLVIEHLRGVQDMSSSHTSHFNY